eukprot:gene11316-17386_t
MATVPDPSLAPNTSAPSTFAPETNAPPVGDEVWVCLGKACRLVGAELRTESDDGLSATENGLIVGLVLLGIVCIALTCALVLLVKKISVLERLKQALDDAKRVKYEVHEDLTHANETLKAQAATLESNVRELESINGPGPPEGTSVNPLANMTQ